MPQAISTYRRDVLSIGLALVTGAAAIGMVVNTVATRESAQSPVVKMADATRRDGCTVITLSPVADRETLGAALGDAALIAGQSGCVAFRFERFADPHRHWTDYEREGR